MKTMVDSRCATYKEFVSDALTQENQNNLHAAAKGHKEQLRQVPQDHLRLELQW